MGSRYTIEIALFYTVAVCWKIYEEMRFSDNALYTNVWNNPRILTCFLLPWAGKLSLYMFFSSVDASVPT